MKCFTPLLIAHSISARGVCSVIEIIAERIANRVGNDNRGSEVNDCLDPMLTDQAGDQRLIASVADDKRGLFGHGPAKAGRQIVENDNALAGIDKLQNHVTADVAGTAGNQDRHLRTRNILSAAYPD